MSTPRKSVNSNGKQVRSLQISNLLIDARNVEILALLEANPRVSVSELARCVGMSAPATRERIQRMEEAGVIRGYQLEIDPAALG
jgi:Lrp/AsnC family leucine-responsive transcriptional regulator